MWYWECKGNKSNISIDPLIHHVYSFRIPLTLFPPSSLSPLFWLYFKKNSLRWKHLVRNDMWAGGCLSVQPTEPQWTVLAITGWSPGLLFAGLLSAGRPDIFKVLSTSSDLLAQILLSPHSSSQHTLPAISDRQLFGNYHGYFNIHSPLWRKQTVYPKIATLICI